LKLDRVTRDEFVLVLVGPAHLARAMKLLTHNMLMSPGTKNGYPLAIEVEKMETVEAEFNGEFTARMVEKLDYAALLSTLRSVSDAGFSAREHVAGTAVCSCL